MPIDLVADVPAAPLASRRPRLAFVAQLVAILVIAGLTIALARLPSSSIAGSAQEVVAGP